MSFGRCLNILRYHFGYSTAKFPTNIFIEELPQTLSSQWSLSQCYDDDYDYQWIFLCNFKIGGNTEDEVHDCLSQMTRDLEWNKEMKQRLHKLIIRAQGKGRKGPHKSRQRFFKQTNALNATHSQPKDRNCKRKAAKQAPRLQLTDESQPALPHSARCLSPRDVCTSIDNGWGPN